VVWQNFVVKMVVLSALVTPIIFYLESLLHITVCVIEFMYMHFYSLLSVYCLPRARHVPSELSVPVATYWEQQHLGLNSLFISYCMVMAPN